MDTRDNPVNKVQHIGTAQNMNSDTCIAQNLARQYLEPLDQNYASNITLYNL